MYQVLGMQMSEGTVTTFATVGVILGAIVLLRLFFKVDLIESLANLFSGKKAEAK